MNENPILVNAFKDGRLIVWDIKKSRILFNNGFYGKPLGNPKPKKDFEEPLILDIVEGVYLLEKGIITVEFDSKVLGIRKLKALARKQFQGFDIKYIIYKDLREK